MAEKTEKSASKTTKVFDVSKPGKSPHTSATARPVIVSNRPIMHDPMMVNTSASEPASAPPLTTATKVVLRPLSESEKNAPASDTSEDAPSKSTTVKVSSAEVIVKTSGSSAPEFPDFMEEGTKKAGASQKKVSESKSTTDEEAAKESEKAPAEEPQPAPAKATEKEADKAPEPVDAPKAAEEKKPPAPVSKAPEPIPEHRIDYADETADQIVGDAPKKKQVLADEAEIKKQAELEELIESRQYHLPINAVERRRSKLAVLFGAVLILVLALALFVLLLDAGIISIPGIVPVTNFF